ncbi:uncharacterized protein LOC120159053 [Hibiscus syriacus]|uniref:uncharacterized protein LOC120159053 n=1 Tax=Hibiscus syriacus TaxID=106335 RepID=UPI0019210A0C|nr:uncharacterized protein LOC120159053 [Hibiscus syriacus]
MVAGERLAVKTMVQEDQTTSSTGKSCKKRRPKKVPQRGLGVAQLEKMRLEEQQKKDPFCRSPSSCEFNVEREWFWLDHGWDFRTSLGIEPVWPLPGLMSSGRQPSSSMVNLSSRTSSTSVMNFQMEPPSNQSHYTYFKPFLPGEKVIAMKRPYPFSLDNVPIHSFHTKYYPPVVHANNGPFEATSNTSKVTTFNSESGTSNPREGPSCSTSNGDFARGFLTLAPPTTTSMCSTSKSKHPRSNSIPYELPASFEESIMEQGGSGLNLQRPYYSFFPPPEMAEIERASAVTMANCKRPEEAAGHVDLNLKL